MTMIAALTGFLKDAFGEDGLFGFSPISDALMAETGCRCALVTLMPYPDQRYRYNAVEYFIMMEDLRKEHGDMLGRVKHFLDDHQIRHASPPATPKDDGEHRAAFSYKWAAIHAGLGFIGKNSVFVHPKYAQKVRISCLLLDLDAPVYAGDIKSECGGCTACVRACPHGLITGNSWHRGIERDALIDYKKCATKSRYGDGAQVKYLCAQCVLACSYPQTT